VWPWTRAVGRRVLPSWLAIALGRHVIAWRDLDAVELAHELEHVRQWREHGWTLPIRYLAASMVAWRAGRSWYRDNRFEVAAREAAEAARG
jgi:hypothetical protein